MTDEKIAHDLRPGRAVRKGGGSRLADPPVVLHDRLVQEARNEEFDRLKLAEAERRARGEKT